MNKYELKYMYETESARVGDLIDINGKNAHLIQELYSKIDQKEKKIESLWIIINEKREKIYELRDIIKSQREKDVRAILDPHGANN